MKLNYALGIKKIIILWIVVFLGGYILNSFFEKINSLDEGLRLIARSHSIPPGFKVEYYEGIFALTNPTADRTKQNTTTQTIKSNDIGPPSKKKIRVSMVANNTPAPASVQSSTAEGCGGPTFGKYSGKSTNERPFQLATSYARTGEEYRKLSKSECAKALRNAVCWRTRQQNLWKPGEVSQLQSPVLKTVRRPGSGMGCTALLSPIPPRYDLEWNVGCKGSTSQCGGRVRIGNNVAKTPVHYYSGDGNTLGVITKTAGTSNKAGNTGMYSPGLTAQERRNNDKNNWDKFNIPIEVGDGIPR